MYFMTASATTDAEHAANPRVPERHTPSTAKAKQTAEEKDLERRQREEEDEEEEEDESRRGFAARERCVGERGERGRFRKWTKCVPDRIRRASHSTLHIPLRYRLLGLATILSIIILG